MSKGGSYAQNDDCPDPSLPQPYPVSTSYTMTTASGAQSFGSCTGTATGTGEAHHASVTCIGTGGTGRLEDDELNFTMNWDTTHLTFGPTGIIGGQVDGKVVGLLSNQ
jgi:hypothetical protein